MLIDRVKGALRTSTTNKTIEDQIQSLIDAGLADLKAVGVDTALDDNGDADPMVAVAVENFVRWHTWTGSDADSACAAYNSLKAALVIYAEAVENADGN